MHKLTLRKHLDHPHPDNIETMGDEDDVYEFCFINEFSTSLCKHHLHRPFFQYYQGDGDQDVYVKLTYAKRCYFL